MAENVGGIEYTVDAQTKQAVDNMNDLVGATRGVVSELKNADQRVKNFERTIASAGNRILQSGKVVNAYGVENKKLTEDLRRLQQQAESTQARGIRQLTQEQAKAVPQVNKLTQAFRVQQGSMQQVGFQLQDIAVQSAQGTNAFVILGQQGSQLASLLGPGGALVGALIAVGALIGTAFSGATETAERSIEELIEKIDELGEKERELLAIRLESEITQAYAAMNEASIQVQILSGNLDDAKKTVADLATESNLLKSVLNATFGESEAENVQELSVEIVEQQAEVERLRRRIDELKQSRDEINDADRKSAENVKEATKAYNDLSSALAGQIASVGRNEREQAKIAAAIQLGAGATIEQTNAINTLIDSYFDLKEASDEATKAQTKYEQESKKTETTMSNLRNQLDVARLSTKELGREAFQLQATQRLGSTATAEQIEQTKQLAGEYYDLSQAARTAKQAEQERQQAISALGQVDAAIGVGFEQGSALKQLEAAYEAQLLSEQAYNDRKVEINRQAEQQIQAIAEERFRSQSAVNDLLIGTLNSLGATATTAFSQFLTGAATAEDVVRSLAQTVLNEAVGALVQLGLEAVKNQIIGQTAQTVAATTAVATGSAIASAYAPAAAFASLASFGANAAPASAGIASTVGLSQSLALAGGLETGGTLTGLMTPVGEGNAPEILSTGSENFMVPGSRGRVFNTEQLSQVGGGGEGVNINVYNNAQGTEARVEDRGNGNVDVIIEKAAKRVQKDFSDSFRTQSGTYFNSVTSNTTANARAR